jgi:8-oxo-dGTP diphosphatase
VKRTIKVVCGVFWKGSNHSPEIALFKRAEPVQEFEFPGGKIEPGESPKQALIRELEEELGILTKVGILIGKNTHEYEQIIVDIESYLINPGNHQFQLREHLEMRWVTESDWQSLKVVEADLPLIQLAFEKIKKSV